MIGAHIKWRGVKNLRPDVEEAQLPRSRRTEGRLRRIGALTGAVTMLLCSAPTAMADPATPGSDVLNAPTLSLTDLGSNDTVSFYGATSGADLSFPVPIGLVPATLNATVDLPFNTRSGLLTVMQDEKVIAKVGLPVVDMAPIVIPLAGVEVVDNRVSLNLTLTAAADDGYCLDYRNPVDLINTSVTYAGIEAVPATVADFMPSVLSKAVIAVPANPSQAEQDAAVQLAADLVAKYRSQDPQISLVALPAGATTLDVPSLPAERQFVIKEGPEASLALYGDPSVVPQMLISGPANALTKQAEFLTDPSLSLAASTRAVAEQMHSEPELPGDSATLDQLGQPGLSAVGASPEVTINLDQTRFGHATEAYRVHLLGSYTPVPNNVGARLTASVSGKVIDRWATDNSGVIDHWVDIPDQLVDRRIGLSVSVDTSGDFGHCNDYQPISLSIGGSSVVLSHGALPPIPTGIRSLPQALMPRVQVGIAPNNFADTVRAVQIVSGLQRLSITALQTKVTSFDDALKGRDSAILISPDGWNNSTIVLPVSTNDRSVTVEGPDGDNDTTKLTLEPGVRFGSLQTVFDTQRSLLVATSNGSADQLDELLRWLDADPKRWGQLRGSAVVSFPGRDPVMVVDRTPVVGPPAPPVWDEISGGHYTYSPAWLVGGGVVVIAVIGAAVIVVSARKSRQKSDSEDSASQD